MIDPLQSVDAFTSDAASPALSRDRRWAQSASPGTLSAHFIPKKCDSDFRKNRDFGVFSAFVTEVSFECSKTIANLSLNGIVAFTGSALARAMEIIPERSHRKRGKQTVRRADLQNVVFAQ